MAIKVNRNGQLAFYLTLLLIGLTQQLAQAQELYLGCDLTYNIAAGFKEILSPVYPNNYNSPSSCRFRFVAPQDHVIDVSCDIQMPISGTRCTTDHFYTSREGLTTRLQDNCGIKTLNFTTSFRRLTFAHVNTGGSSGGKYRCKLNARRACDCGWSNTENEFPSMVALKDRQNPQGAAYCAGTIISHTHILTAAQCRRKQPDASRIIAIVGIYDVTSDGDTAYSAEYDIRSITEHTNYDPTKNTFDISVLVTTTEIEWSRGVGAICMPLRTTTQSFVDQIVELMGFRHSSRAGRTTLYLQKAQRTITENDVCKQRIADKNILAQDAIATQMCTYEPQGLQQTCPTTAGGPVILRRTRQFIVGIISGLEDCVTRDTMSIATRITSLLNYINTLTTNMCIVQPNV